MSHVPIQFGDNSPTVTFYYANYKGEREKRCVDPRRLVFGSTVYHPEPQWLLIAYDWSRAAERYFALKDIQPETVQLWKP